MPFCPKCGEKVSNDAQYCTACGQLLKPEIRSSVVTERKSEYRGVIRKCPSCGTPIDSFVATCPSCGHVFTNSQVNYAIKDFTNALNQFDQRIAREPQALVSKGYQSWSKAGKTWWVIANIFFVCYPLIIYLIVRWVKGAKQLVTPAQKEKASFVDNYVFPNDKETIIEAFLLVHQKLTVLASEGITELSEFWEKVWFAKANQLYSKSELALIDDISVNRAYSEMQTIHRNFKKRKMMKIAIVIVGVILLFVFARVFS